MDPRLFLSRIIFSHFPLQTRINIDKTAVMFMLLFITYIIHIPAFLENIHEKYLQFVESIVAHSRSS